MAKVKSSTDVAKKWARVTPQRTEDYAEGVKAPRTDWAAATTAAKANYAAGVQAGITNDSFAKGVAKAGTAKWQKKAVEVGSARFGQGVAAAGPEFESGIAPYLQVIASTTLPPKYPKGDPRNIDRVRAIAVALRKKKTG